jgi:hypothetical protein
MMIPGLLSLKEVCCKRFVEKFVKVGICLAAVLVLGFSVSAL